MATRPRRKTVIAVPQDFLGWETEEEGPLRRHAPTENQPESLPGRSAPPGLREGADRSGGAFPSREGDPRPRSGRGALTSDRLPEDAADRTDGSSVRDGPSCLDTGCITRQGRGNAAQRQVRQGVSSTVFARSRDRSLGSESRASRFGKDDLDPLQRMQATQAAHVAKIRGRRP
jgi:hypothetical protein